ncbi:MAG: tyrosine-type recombinase/integrase [Candidatus Spechtbacterales bacterium]
MYNSDKPIKNHISGFLDYCEVEKGLSNNTQVNYQRYLNILKKWLKETNNEGLLPHQLTPEHVWDYRLFLARKYKTKNGKNLAKSTQNYYLVALRALLDYFSDRDITSLPSNKVKLPKDAKKDSVKFLTLEQMQKLLEMPDINTENGLRDRTIMEVLFSTGLRIAELVALNRDQISMKNTDDVFELSITGKGSRTRTIFFSPRAMDWLKKYMEKRTLDTDKALFINYSNSTSDDRRLSVRSIQESIKRYGIMAGLPVEVTPHVLRHTYATDLLAQGVDLRSVQEFLGHKNIATTQIYTHLTNKRLKEIHKKFHGGNSLEK